MLGGLALRPRTDAGPGGSAIGIRPRQKPARVSDARPRMLGVHASIEAEGADGELPTYVPRDLDAELGSAIAAAAERGGFVLLIGGSSVGKTRSLFEVLRAVLPSWSLVHPADGAAVQEFDAARLQPIVVWLDELQGYLDTVDGLSAAMVRALVGAGFVVVGTLWADEYNVRSTPPMPGETDRFAEDRELIGLARVIDVPGAFSVDERHRAEAAAKADKRIRIALDTPDAGITQVLAAGPELVRRWENAPANLRYGQAVITAALDARRVGGYEPVSREYLQIAAPAYLTVAERPGSTRLA